MNAPKLILLHGFAGVGKTTIANRYIQEHPLALNLEGDEVIAMIGQWLAHETKARELTFTLSKAMAMAHVRAGHDVIIPYLPTVAERIMDFERAAQEAEAQFFEIVLAVEREEAIQRLLKRGTWGEEGTESLTESDLPTIEKLYDDMERALAKRPYAVRLVCTEGNVDETYQQFLNIVSTTQPQ